MTGVSCSTLSGLCSGCLVVVVWLRYYLNSEVLEDYIYKDTANKVRHIHVLKSELSKNKNRGTWEHLI